MDGSVVEGVVVEPIIAVSPVVIFVILEVDVRGDVSDFSLEISSREILLSPDGL